MSQEAAAAIMQRMEAEALAGDRYAVEIHGGRSFRVIVGFPQGRILQGRRLAPRYRWKVDGIAERRAVALARLARAISGAE